MHNEIGGYIELSEYDTREYYPSAVALNCGRNALAYLVEAKHYVKVYIPEFSCDSIAAGIRRGGAQVVYYTVDENMQPMFDEKLLSSEAILVINYYGQLSNNMLEKYQKKYQRIIVDNTQAFFQQPIANTDTIYSCRKFFGVADGAYLFSDVRLNRKLLVDKSAKRMLFVLGRYDDNCAEKYYEMAAQNNAEFSQEPIKQMSRLTHNLLAKENYARAAFRRQENARLLHARLGIYNRLNFQAYTGAFMYPLWSDGLGDDLRKYLLQYKIYIPCLWPDVFKREKPLSLAYQMARNIVPVPCDQRYDSDDMSYMIDKIVQFIRGKGVESK